MIREIRRGHRRAPTRLPFQVAKAKGLLGPIPRHGQVSTEMVITTVRAASPIRGRQCRGDGNGETASHGLIPRGTFVIEANALESPGIQGPSLFQDPLKG